MSANRICCRQIPGKTLTICRGKLRGRGPCTQSLKWSFINLWPGVGRSRPQPKPKAGLGLPTCREKIVSLLNGVCPGHIILQIGVLRVSVIGVFISRVLHMMFGIYFSPSLDLYLYSFIDTFFLIIHWEVIRKELLSSKLLLISTWINFNLFTSNLTSYLNWL